MMKCIPLVFTRSKTSDYGWENQPKFISSSIADWLQRIAETRARFGSKILAPSVLYCYVDGYELAAVGRVTDDQDSYGRAIYGLWGFAEAVGQTGVSGRCLLELYDNQLTDAVGSSAGVDSSANKEADEPSPGAPYVDPGPSSTSWKFDDAGYARLLAYIGRHRRAPGFFYFGPHLPLPDGIVETIKIVSDRGEETILGHSAEEGCREISGTVSGDAAGDSMDDSSPIDKPSIDKGGKASRLSNFLRWTQLDSLVAASSIEDGYKMEVMVDRHGQMLRTQLTVFNKSQKQIISLSSKDLSVLHHAFELLIMRKSAMQPEWLVPRGDSPISR